MRTFAYAAATLAVLSAAGCSARTEDKPIFPGQRHDTTDTVPRPPEIKEPVFLGMDTLTADEVFYVDRVSDFGPWAVVRLERMRREKAHKKQIIYNRLYELASGYPLACNNLRCDDFVYLQKRIEELWEEYKTMQERTGYCLIVPASAGYKTGSILDALKPNFEPSSCHTSNF